MTKPKQRQTVKVRRTKDGLWLHFGPHVALSLDYVVAGCGPIVAANVRAFCERIAEPSAND